MFQFLTHVELSRSMAAILEMPQYVAYQKNAVYAFIKLSAKSQSFNILRTMDGLSYPTMGFFWRGREVGGGEGRETKEEQISITSNTGLTRAITVSFV